MKGMKLISLILGLWVLFSPLFAAGILNISNYIVGILLVLIVCVEVFGGKTKPQV